ncbi:hypothetical protein ACF3NW_08335 [Eikenella halliae]
MLISNRFPGYLQLLHGFYFTGSIIKRPAGNIRLDGTNLTILVV